mgnify:CR=1 FL=1
MKYVRKLMYDESPNYNYMMSLFEDCLGKLNDKFDAYAAAEYGLTFQYFEGSHSTLMAFGIVGGARYSFAEKFKAFAELENLYQFAKKDKVNYSDIKLNVNLGVEYQF